MHYIKLSVNFNRRRIQTLTDLCLVSLPSFYIRWMGWLVGGKQKMWFPSNYVEEIDDGEEVEMCDTTEVKFYIFYLNS